MIVEEADLPAGLIGELERMLAVWQKDLGRAGVDADAARDRFGAVGLLLAVALDRKQLEIHLAAAALGDR